MHHLDSFGGDCGDTTSGLSLLSSFNFLHFHQRSQVFLILNLNGAYFYEWHGIGCSWLSKIDPWNEVRPSASLVLLSRADYCPYRCLPE